MSKPPTTATELRIAAKQAQNAKEREELERAKEMQRADDNKAA